MPVPIPTMVCHKWRFSMGVSPMASLIQTCRLRRPPAFWMGLQTCRPQPQPSSGLKIEMIVLFYSNLSSSPNLSPKFYNTKSSITAFIKEARGTKLVSQIHPKCAGSSSCNVNTASLHAETPNDTCEQSQWNAAPSIIITKRYTTALKTPGYCGSQIIGQPCLNCHQNKLNFWCEGPSPSDAPVRYKV